MEENMVNVENTEVENEELESTECTEKEANITAMIIVGTFVAGAAAVAAGVKLYKFAKKKIAERKAKKDLVAGKDLDVSID